MNTARIKIWGDTVGAVYWNEKKGLAAFEYEKKFVDTGYELSPLRMPLQSRKIYEFPDLKSGRDALYNTFRGLPGLLADSLPDRYGNELIAQWLVRQGRNRESLNPVELLCFIGERGMGALEYEPSLVEVKNNLEALELKSIVEVAARILHQKENWSTHIEDDKTISDIIRIGTSAGGARPKAVIAYHSATGEVRSGQLKLPKGFEHWLIKLDGVSDIQVGSTTGYGRVEYAYYLMAQECGISMMPSKLLEENGRAHFMTQRFDRDEYGNRHHIQTWCGLAHYDFNLAGYYSYEELFQTMRALQLDYPSMEEMYRRMVFNVLMRNCDDHTKNFSFMLRKNEKWELAPAYDLCYAYHPDHTWVGAHNLTLQGKRDHFLLEDLLTIAKQNSVRKPRQLIEQILDIRGLWKHYAGLAGVSKELQKLIADNFISLK